MLTLLERQQLFSKTLAKFISDLNTRGYELTLGEAYRPPAVAQLYAAENKGIANSNHIIRLAIDLNIFYQGKLLTEKVDLSIPGTLWKSYSTDLVQCVWGGRLRDDRLRPLLIRGPEWNQVSPKRGIRPT